MDTVNGFLIENETEALAKTLSDLIEFPETIRKAGIGARKSLYRNWETIVDEVNMKYLEIIKFHNPELILNKHIPQQVNDFNPLLAEMGYIHASSPV